MKPPANHNDYFDNLEQELAQLRKRQEAARAHIYGKSVEKSERLQPKTSQKSFRWWWLTGYPLAAVFVIVLPFMLFLKLGTFLYLNEWAGSWTSVFYSITATAVVVTATLLLLFRKIIRSLKAAKRLFISVAVLILLICGFGLISISQERVKHPEDYKTYTQLHPWLRLASATAFIWDDELLLTDTRRTRSDYLNMGLTPYSASLHYMQESGFVHAIDIRTLGRSRFQNAVTQLYYRALGFRVIRHTGTADHIHVEIPVR